MSGIRNFVNYRVSSPQPRTESAFPPQSIAQRQKIAENAKVNIGDLKEKKLTQVPSNGIHNSPGVNRQTQLAVNGQKTRRQDAFDSDYSESSTVRSAAMAEDRPVVPEESNPGNDEDEYLTDGKDGNKNGQTKQQPRHYNQHGPSPDAQVALDFLHNMADQFPKDGFGGASSYPTTTSGRQDNEYENDSDIDAAMLDDIDDIEEERPIGRTPERSSTSIRHPQTYTEPTTGLRHAGVNQLNGAQVSTLVDLSGATPSNKPARLRQAQVGSNVVKPNRNARLSAIQNAGGRSLLRYAKNPPQGTLAEELPSDVVETESSLDYPRQELGMMSYSQLQSESFDHNPTPVEKESGLSLAGSLTEKLDAARALGPSKQQQFFSSLQLSEWEEAGDWFLGRFGDMVTKIREARGQKRKLATEFEDQVTVRHEEVESRKRGLDRVLDDMKRGGTDVLKMESTGPQEKKRRKE